MVLYVKYKIIYVSFRRELHTNILKFTTRLDFFVVLIFLTGEMVFTHTAYYFTF